MRDIGRGNAQRSGPFASKRPRRDVQDARERMECELRVQPLLDHELVMPILNAVSDSSPMGLSPIGASSGGRLEPFAVVY